MKEKEELNKIVEKSKYLFLKYGIRSVTMDDIARELGISKKTLYACVCDKSDLVKLVIEREITEKDKDLSSIYSMGMNAIDELFHFNKFLICLLNNYSPVVDYDLRKYFPELFERISEIKRNKIYEFVFKNLQKGKQQGIYRDDLDEEIIARLYVTRATVITENPLFDQTELASDKFNSQIFIYHIRGIASDSGLEYLNNCIEKSKINQDL